MNLPNHDFILKSITANDDVFLTDDGKHVVFRNIRGKIVPIKVDASKYVDWLQTQGVQVDTSSQEAIGQAEEILDTLQRAGELGGKDYQMQYEKKVLDYYHQAQGLGYDQAVENRAKTKGTTAEQLKKNYQAQYDSTKSDEKDYTGDKESEWGSFITHYTSDMLQRSGIDKVGTTEWGAVQGIDLMLRVGLENAKNNVPPSKLDLVKMLQEEIDTRTALTKNFSAHYAVNSDAVEKHLVAISMLDGMKLLIKNLNEATPFGQGLDKEFDAIYAKMYQEYGRSTAKDKFSFSRSIIPDSGIDVPTDLPDKFNRDEATSLLHNFENATGSKLNQAHKTIIHSLVRMERLIPADKKASVAVELSSDVNGLHSSHQIGFERAFTDAKLGLTFDVKREVEEALRDASYVKNPLEAVNAMKSLAMRLGRIDGYYAHKQNPKATNREVSGLWQNSPIAAGRKAVKGDGPNLMQFITEPQTGENALIPNSTLKVLHQKQVPKAGTKESIASATPEFDFDFSSPAPTQATPATPAAPEAVKASEKEVYPGVIRTGPKDYKTRDDYRISISGTPDRLNVSVVSPSGEQRSVLVHKHNYISKEEFQAAMFESALNLKMRLAVGEPTQETPAAPAAPAPSASVSRARSTTLAVTNNTDANTLSAIMDYLSDENYSQKAILKNAVKVNGNGREFLLSVKDGKLSYSQKGSKGYATTIPLKSFKQFKEYMGETPIVASEVDMSYFEDLTEPEQTAISDVFNRAKEKGFNIKIAKSTGEYRIMNGDDYISLRKRNGSLSAVSVNGDARNPFSIEKLAAEFEKFYAEEKPQELKEKKIEEEAIKEPEIKALSGNPLSYPTETMQQIVVLMNDDSLDYKEKAELIEKKFNMPHGTALWLSDQLNRNTEKGKEFRNAANITKSVVIPKFHL